MELWNREISRFLSWVGVKVHVSTHTVARLTSFSQKVVEICGLQNHHKLKFGVVVPSNPFQNISIAGVWLRSQDPIYLMKEEKPVCYDNQYSAEVV